MSLKLSLENLSQLPSFSRVGKGCSNQEDIKTMDSKLEKENRRKKHGRSRITYQSLSEVPPILEGYNVDIGARSRPIVSSPRIAPNAAAMGTVEQDVVGLKFERVMKWDDFPTSAGKRGSGDQQEGGREVPMKPKAIKQVTPSAAFKTTTRDRDSMSVRMREVGRLTPGVGHYDAEPDNIRPKRDKLTAILNKDRPHAPSFKVERLMSTLPARPASTPLPVTPRTSFKLLREIDQIPSSNHKAVAEVLKRAVTPGPFGDTGLSGKAHNLSSTAGAVSKQMSVESGAEESVQTDGGGEGGDGTQPQASAEGDKLIMTGGGTLGRTGSVPSELSYSNRIPGPNMDRMLARYKQSGEPTLTGYLAPRGGEAAQCSYDNLDALRGHMSTPDLSRSGKDYKDLLLRLGYTPPGSKPMPEYWGFVGALDWNNPNGWVKATRPATSTACVSMDKMLSRRPPQREEEPRLQLRHHRDGKMWDGCVQDDRNPSFPHTPSVSMARNSGSHDVLLVKPSQCKTERYRVNERLTSKRTQVIMPFGKGTSRRPLTADGFTGKPLRETADIFYDTDHAESNVVRTRIKSPVDLGRSVGRDKAQGGELESGAGGLHGTHYWGEIGWRTDATAHVMRNKRLPDMAKSPGRVSKGGVGQSSMSRDFEGGGDEQPLWETAKIAMQKGGFWDPKDCVKTRNVPTPNLDANPRARDAELEAKNRGGSDLYYDVNYAAVEPRTQVTTIYSKNANPI